MQAIHKVPLVLAALAFALAAIAEIATGRSRLPQDDDAVERARRAALVTVDDALHRGDTLTALRAWQQAYEAARMSRGWRALVDVADVRMRIGDTTGVAAAAPRAREAYFAALSRARADRSVDGAVGVAEGFARLGDREATEYVLRMAASLATRNQDSAASRRVETVRGRLLTRPSARPAPRSESGRSGGASPALRGGAPPCYLVLTMPSIAATVTETIHWVFPEHAGAPGQIHGGRMMQWITHAGTMAAARVAKGTVVLGAMDDIDFLHPVKVGEIAILRARVEYIGTSSLEVGVRVWAENVATGARAVTLNSHLVFVNVDEQVRPRPVGATIEPRDAAEAALVEAARARRDQRRVRFAEKAARLRDIDTSANEEFQWRFESSRSVLPEDALFGNMMFPGKMLMELDEAGGILSMRYCRGFVMTACLDAMDFYTPIYTHEVVTFKAGLNHVGTSSLEVGVKVLAEQPWSGEVRHACTAYLTYVHLGGDLRPQPCRPFTPGTEGERRRWAAALARRERRIERVKRLKAALSNERG